MTDPARWAQGGDRGIVARVEDTIATVGFDAVYRDGLAHVWKCLRRLGVREKDLEDAAHDVFVAVHAHLAEFDSARPLHAWLAGFAWRIAANYRRAAPQRREELTDDVPEHPDTRENADQVAARGQQRTLVLRALDALDDEKRAVFVLHELEGLAIPEVASLLGVPLNTAYSRLRLGRAIFVQRVRALAGKDGSP